MARVVDKNWIYKSCKAATLEDV